MPLLVAPLFAVSLGLCFGLLTLDGRGARGWLAARSSVRLFAALAFFPALLLPALLRPAWAAMQFTGRPPSALLLAGAAIAAGAVPLVYERASALGTLPRGRAVATAALPGALGLLVLAALHRRALVLTPAVPRLEEPEPLFGSPMGVAFLLIDVLLLAAAGLTAFALADEARPEEPRLQIGRKLLPAAPSDAAGVVRQRGPRTAPAGKRTDRALK
jgi:hypothetical protein